MSSLSCVCVYLKRSPERKPDHSAGSSAHEVFGTIFFVAVAPSSGAVSALSPAERPNDILK